MENREKPYKILFVCMGNICRSPLAHAVMDRELKDRGMEDRVELESCGTGAWHVGELPDRRMRSEAAKHGVNMDHRARHLRRSDLDEFDLILTMDRENYRNTLALSDDSDHQERVRMFRDFDPESGSEIDVPDPYYGGRTGFAQVYDIVERTCASLADELEEPESSAI